MKKEIRELKEGINKRLATISVSPIPLKKSMKKERIKKKFRHRMVNFLSHNRETLLNLKSKFQRPISDLNWVRNMHKAP